MSQLWNDPGFLEIVKKTKAGGGSNTGGPGPGSGPGAPQQPGPAPAGPDAPANGPGGGSKKWASDVVHNPGEAYWSVITANELDPEADNHSAGALRQGTEYADYEGWQPFTKTIILNAGLKFPILKLTFNISARVRGHPKDDPDKDRYLGEVRVQAEKPEGRGLVNAKVEGARATWHDGRAAVKFTLVVDIKEGQLDGGGDTVRASVIVFGAGSPLLIWSQ